MATSPSSISQSGPGPVRVGRYDLFRVLGRGGMATVHLARQVDLERLVALKQLDGLTDRDGLATQRFVRESRLAGSLSHPNIVTVHDSFEFGGVPYIAMELVPGGSLRGLLQGLSLEQVAGVLEGVLAGLMHAERRGIVHRDLKPENLLVSSDGGIKITDYGIAKATGDAQLSALTSAGSAIGTPAYMAPEQAMGREVGPWTDLYSLGIVAFEMLAGQVPFTSRESSVDVLLQHVNDAPPLLADVRPGIDPELSAWVAALLAKRPGDRPVTAAAAREQLEDVVVRLRGPLWRRAAPLPVFAEDDDVEPTLEHEPMLRQPFTAPRQASTRAVTRQPLQSSPPPAVPASVPTAGAIPAHRSLPWGKGLLVLLGLGALAATAGAMRGDPAAGGGSRGNAGNAGALSQTGQGAAPADGTDGAPGAAGASPAASAPATKAPAGQSPQLPSSGADTTDRRDETPAPVASGPTASAPVASAPSAQPVDAGQLASQISDAERSQQRFAEEAQDSEGDGDEQLTRMLRETTYAYRDAAALGRAGDGAGMRTAMDRADAMATEASARLDD